MRPKQVLPPIKAHNDVLSFGRYCGKSVEDILDDNPGYLVWLQDENICEVDEEIYQEAQLYDWADREYAHNEQPRTYGDLD